MLHCLPAITSLMAIKTYYQMRISFCKLFQKLFFQKLLQFLDIIYWNFATFQKSFDSQQVKQYLISSIKAMYIRVASQVHERFATQKIRMYQKNVKIGWKQSLVSSFSSRNKIFVMMVKNYTKGVIKFICCSPISHSSSSLLQIFWQGFRSSHTEVFLGKEQVFFAKQLY